MTYRIIDNFLSSELFKPIQQELLNAEFPWYMNNSIVKNSNSGIQEKYNWQFTHSFYSDFNITSKWFGLVNPILDKLNPSALIRIKANLLPATDNQITHSYHLDQDCFDGKIAIFYVNSNDGYTIFEDGTKIESVENRLLIFDPDILHTGTTCTDEKVRCVINFVYYNYTNTIL